MFYVFYENLVPWTMQFVCGLFVLCNQLNAIGIHKIYIYIIALKQNMYIIHLYAILYSQPN